MIARLACHMLVETHCQWRDLTVFYRALPVPFRRSPMPAPTATTAHRPVALTLWACARTWSRWDTSTGHDAIVSYPLT